MTDYQVEPSSFRDSNGRVFYCRGNIYRGLSKKALCDWERLSSTNLFPHFLAAGKLVGTTQVDPTDEGFPPDLIQDWAAVLKHQAVPFVSYPYEWSFSMLKNAALLHLELLLAALDEDMILKDSSAFNVQWIGTTPVFIDIPSFEILQPGDPWVGYRQFCQLFLYPLFLQAYKDVAFHPWLRGSIDGIAPEQFNNLMSTKDLLRPGIFLNVFLQAKIQNRYGDADRDIKVELQKACFNKKLIEANVQRIQKLVQGLEWKRSNSEWSSYANTHSYSDSDHRRKTEFVREIVTLRRWPLVWDIGCNTGTFSKIAAENADCVVALDFDHLAIDHLYRSLNDDDAKNILPLVANIADPSPNLGWRGQERKSLARRGKPELTLCLALIHHIVIGANVPLQEFVQWLASLHTSLVIEFVTKDDVMVKKLLCNKESNHDEYEVEYFENCLKNSFTIQRSEILESRTRILYFAEIL
ncbi:class I SAM-dependent methyltransferase [Deltaproteobacteria bacterium IMCC39524]|nr:class I SAM-dependent methyltransferase [Deltaproteobacteria bacterium IMCC39524]